MPSAEPMQSDLIVRFTSHDVIHAGDLFSNGFYPNIDASSLGWIGGMDAPLSLSKVVLKRIRVQGISVAPLEAHERMVAAIEATGLEPVIDHVYGFGQLREAFEHMAAGRHFGKLAIDFNR